MKKMCFVILTVISICMVLVLGKYIENREINQNVEITKCQDEKILEKENSSNIVETNEYQKSNIDENIEFNNTEKIITICSIVTFLFIVSAVYEITA